MSKKGEKPEVQLKLRLALPQLISSKSFVEFLSTYLDALNYVFKKALIAGFFFLLGAVWQSIFSLSHWIGLGLAMGWLLARDWERSSPSASNH